MTDTQLNETAELFLAQCETAITTGLRALENLKELQVTIPIRIRTRSLDASEVQALLIEKRRRLGVSLRKAAKLSGSSASTLSRVENGRVFDWDTGQAILRWVLEEETQPMEQPQ